MLNGNIFSKTVDTHRQRVRLDSYLSLSGAPTSRSRLKKLIEQGFVQINGETVTTPHHFVKRGDTITISFPKEPVMSLEPQKIDIKIVYEDEDIIVIDKQPGIVVHPAKGNREGTLVNALLFHSSLTKAGSDKYRPGIVHRLDKDTSGLMVTAKTESSYSSLQEQISSREMRREYLALVWGEPPMSGFVEAPIGRSRIDRKKMAVTSYLSKEAKTHFKTLVSYGAVSLLLCRLETGRTHQIRVHMKHIGHSVVGDRDYGGNAVYPKGVSVKWSSQVQVIKKLASRQILHAARLSFRHPKEGVYVNFFSPFPEDMLPLFRFLSKERTRYFSST